MLVIGTAQINQENTLTAPLLFHVSNTLNYFFTFMPLIR